MIRKIIACSDIHIRNFKRHEEYVGVLKTFIQQCQKIVKKYGTESVRIVIAGDLFHNKLDISGEGYQLAAWFLTELNKVATTLVIAGNHDMNMLNTDRVDPISTLFSLCKFDNAFYVDKDLNYESGVMNDDNVTWCLYSVFDNFARPNIEEARVEHPDNTYVALFHGEVKNAKTDAGWVAENGKDTGIFEGVDFGILGHIHRVQCIKQNGAPLVYCGSMIQQEHGENVSTHGYLIWDVQEQEYETVEIPNPNYGFYTFSINDPNDIDEDIEEVINL